MRPLPPILIADDDADDQFMLKRALQKAKVENPIVTFNDGDDVLHFLNGKGGENGKSVTPCLLFLDLNMPRMTGFDVLSALGQARLFDQVKTVVISSSARDEDADRARSLGASEYVIKFPAPDRLSRIIAAACAALGAGKWDAPQHAA